MKMPKTSVYLVDDDVAVRDSLSGLLTQVGLGVSTFASAKAFLDAYIADGPACLITDLNMPEMDGLELHEKMLQHGIELPIIYLTGFGEIPTTVRAMKLGAVDFLTKPIARSKLLESINHALTLDQRRLTNRKSVSSFSAQLASLTGRERDVLEAAIEGKQLKEIGRVLGISYRTVEVHKARLLKKMAVSSLGEFTARVIELGIDVKAALSRTQPNIGVRTILEEQGIVRIFDGFLSDETISAAVKQLPSLDKFSSARYVIADLSGISGENISDATLLQVKCMRDAYKARLSKLRVAIIATNGSLIKKLSSLDAESNDPSSAQIKIVADMHAARQWVSAASTADTLKA